MAAEISSVTRPEFGTRRARRDFDGLMIVARAELEAVIAGELEAFWGLHRAVNQALGIMLTNRLDAA